MNLKSPISLISHGINLFASLLRSRPFLWAYLLCFGFYDIFSALYASSRPDEVASQVQIAIVIGGNLSLFMTVFVLLILNGNQPVFAGRTWLLISRTWTANLVAGCYILLGFICLIIPGIILTLRYLYISEAIVVENLGLNAALVRSRRLSAANGGRTFWAATIVFVAWFIAYLLCSFAFGIVFGYEALNSFAFNYIIQISSSVMGVLLAACVYSGYLDARAFEADKSTGPHTSLQSGQESSQELSDDRILGKTYAASLSNYSAASLQQRQAVLRDLLSSDLTLWPPLRHLIEQQGFISMLQAQSPASRIAARDALLQELDGHYLPHVMERVRAFMGGLLES